MKPDFNNKIILGPMAGVTDLPFRLLCREFGADAVCTEMVSAKAVLYNNKNTEMLLRSDRREEPVILQLFGSDPDICADIAERLEGGPWMAIDFNMGCPVPKVVNNGEGSALLKNPPLAGRIISAMTKRIKKPVTVKIRKGFDENSVNAVEMARILEDSGAAAITVHGRTRAEFYHGRADWDIIREVKEAVSIPVIGNGDVDSYDKIREIREYTGCDSVMIARGALGRPWIFSKDGFTPDKDELKEIMLRHLQMQIDHNGEYTALREMRKHLAWYTKGMPASSSFRNTVNTIEELPELIDKISTI